MPNQAIGVVAHVALPQAGGELVAAHAPRTVGPHDDPGPDLVVLSLVVGEPHRGAFGGEVGHRHLGDPEADVDAGRGGTRRPGRRRRRSAGRATPRRPLRRGSRSGALAPPKAQLDALVLVPLAEHPVRDAAVDQQPDAVALEDARAVGLLDLATAADVDRDRVDARCSASRWEIIRPAGPAPTTATCVVVCFTPRSRRSAGRRPGPRARRTSCRRGRGRRRRRR